MEFVITATEARVRFGEMMRRIAENQEAIIVERGGKPQIVMLSLSRYRQLLAAQQGRESWQEKLEQAHVKLATELAGKNVPDAAEMIRQMRKTRDEQFMDLH